MLLNHISDNGFVLEKTKNFFEIYFGFDATIYIFAPLKDLENHFFSIFKQYIAGWRSMTSRLVHTQESLNWVYGGFNPPPASN